MSWLLFESEAAAESYVASVDAVLGFPRAGVPAAAYPFGWTLTYATPLAEHDGTRFAVPAHSSVPAPQDAEEVDVLPHEWSGPGVWL